MSEMGYVYFGYIVAFGTLAAYSLRTILRGRKLSRALPAKERTWS
jgi:hypothetical protein